MIVCRGKRVEPIPSRRNSGSLNKGYLYFSTSRELGLEQIDIQAGTDHFSDFHPYTLSDEISAVKIFGGQNFSADKIFGTMSKFP